MAVGRGDLGRPTAAASLREPLPGGIGHFRQVHAVHVSQKHREARVSFLNIQRYDALKVIALLNEIAARHIWVRRLIAGALRASELEACYELAASRLGTRAVQEIHEAVASRQSAAGVAVEGGCAHARKRSPKR